MASREDPEHIGSNAPLLPSEDPNGYPFPDTEDEILPVSTSDGWFIWFLTFSAGISGLLFGYEYERSILTYVSSG